MQSLSEGNTSVAFIVVYRTGNKRNWPIGENSNNNDALAHFTQDFYVKNNAPATSDSPKSGI